MEIEKKEDTVVMTPEEFADEMRKIQDRLDNSDRPWDFEYSHRAMDRTMCELLESLGYGAGVDIFLNAHKWYA